MYASSFIGTFVAVEAALEQGLSIETYNRPEPPLMVADETTAAIKDAGALSEAALTNVRLEGYEEAAGDEAVEELLVARIDGGLDAKLPEDPLEIARAEDRVHQVADTVLIPVDDAVPGVRNWWLLEGLLATWLEKLAGGFQRIYLRSQVDGTDRVETAFWIVLEQLKALQESFVQARTVGSYTMRSVRPRGSQLSESVCQLARALTGGEHA